MKTFVSQLLLGIDLTSLNPTLVPITFIHSSNITVDFIKFDKTYVGNQKLVTHFRNVEMVTFRGLHVDEAIEVKGFKKISVVFLKNTT